MVGVLLPLYLLGKFSEKARKVFLLIKEKIVWNAFIRFFLHGTLKLQITTVTVVILAVSS